MCAPSLNDFFVLLGLYLVIGVLIAEWQWKRDTKNLADRWLLSAIVVVIWPLLLIAVFDD